MSLAPSRCAAGPSMAIEGALLQTIAGLTQLLAQLCDQIPQAQSASTDAQAGSAPAPRSPIWEELSVVELRALLRSYPIDRTSLPAPIELLRRAELIEALNQIQAITP